MPSGWPGQRAPAPVSRAALRRGAVALLELLAAPAWTGIVATDVGVRIRSGDAGAHGRRTGPPGRLAAHQAISRRLTRHHRRRTARRRPLHQARSAEGPAAGRPGRGSAPRRPDFDLQLEPALREGRVEVAHQADEHVVGFRLVLEQGVFLTPGPVLNRRAQLIEIVEVVLPFLVDYREHDVRQRLATEVHGADLGFDVLEVLELGVERRPPCLTRVLQGLVADPVLGRYGGAL